MRFPEYLLSETKCWHPELFVKIKLHWGHPEMDLFFEQAITTRRSGRQGFHPSVWSELVEAYIVHKDHFTFDHNRQLSTVENIC